MRKFRFKLNTILEYRRLQEQWAQDAFLETRVRRIEAEAEREALSSKQHESLNSHPENIQKAKSLETYIERLDDEIRAQEAVISLLLSEEEKAKQTWIERRRDAEALQKLHDRAYETWQKEQERAEQAALDEWAVTRRVAA